MAFFLFGKKRRSTRKKASPKKPPAKILRMCKKLKIKCTVKRGGKRVYRKVSVLKKLISRKKGRKTVSRSAGFGARRRHKARFGFGAEASFSNAGPAGYGYNQPVVQKPGILNQSSQIVSSSTNDARPSGLGLPGEYLPTYGVYRPFFGENVPTQVGPNWNFMGQPDGSAFAVGGPFARYTAPASFGRRGRRGFGAGGCGSPLLTRDANGKCVFKSNADIKKRLTEKAKGAYAGAKKAYKKAYAGAKEAYKKVKKGLKKPARNEPDAADALEELDAIAEFGAGGCGSPLLTRDANGRCVFKSKADIKKRLTEKANAAYANLKKAYKKGYVGTKNAYNRLRN
jgi:hypothetical protein